jgi:TetR/AcrR family transcriptional repressor of nem operon
MSQRNDTRARILGKGAQLIHARGYNATGLQEILSVAGVPKGSFYFYFKSKEEFCLELIDYFAAFIGEIFSRNLDDTSIAPAGRIGRLFDFYEDFFSKNSCGLGCPIGNLSLELGDAGEAFRGRLAAAIDSLITKLESCLLEMKREGSIPAALDTGEAARFIFHGFEGAILHMKVARNLEPLRTFRRCVLEYLHAPRGNA